MVTYELFYTPETAKMHKENKLSDIDERIAKIEKLVGSSAGQALDDFVSLLHFNQRVVFDMSHFF